MWGTSPDVDQKCAVRSYLLTALERSGDRSPNSNVPLVADLNVTIQMRVTIIDRMDGMNKNLVNPVILSKKPRRRRLSSKMVGEEE